MADTSEQTIKPGDMVRYKHAGREALWRVAWVDSDGVYTIYDTGGFDAAPFEWVQLVTAGTVEDEQRATLAAMTALGMLHSRPYLPEKCRKEARAEALRRGWRELDREDVTLEATHQIVRANGERIGEVYDNGDGWRWEYDADGDLLPRFAVDHDAAVNAVIAATNNARALAAENARRAKERTDG